MRATRLAFAALIVSAAAVADPPAGAADPVGPPWEGERPARAGEPVPAVAVYTASGSIVGPEAFRGKTVLLTFWSLADGRHPRQIDRLAEVRRAFAREPDFLMVSVQVVKNGRSDHDDWIGFLDGRGTVSYPDRGTVRFDSDPRWWQVFEAGDPEINARVRRHWGVTGTPRSFLIGPDGRLLAADIPLGRLRGTLARHFEGKRAADAEGPGGDASGRPPGPAAATDRPTR